MCGRMAHSPTLQLVAITSFSAQPWSAKDVWIFVVASSLRVYRRDKIEASVAWQRLIHHFQMWNEISRFSRGTTKGWDCGQRSRELNSNRIDKYISKVWRVGENGKPKRKTRRWGGPRERYGCVSWEYWSQPFLSPCRSTWGKSAIGQLLVDKIPFVTRQS